MSDEKIEEVVKEGETSISESSAETAKSMGKGIIEDMIDSIIAAEDRAQDIVKASVNKSNDIVNEAKLKAQAMVLSAKDEQYAKEQSAVAEGEKKGAELRSTQLEEAQKQADAMDAILEKNKKKVTESIIKELKGKYGIK